MDLAENFGVLKLRKIMRKKVKNKRKWMDLKLGGSKTINFAVMVKR